MSYKNTKDPRIKKFDSGVYHARFSLNGVRVQESLKTKNFSLALSMVKKIEQKILLGEFKKETNEETFEVLWPKFITELKLKNRSTTVREYELMAEKYYMLFWIDYTPKNITTEACIEFIRFLQQKSPGILIFNPRKYFLNFLGWLVKKGKLSAVPEFPNPDRVKSEQREESEVYYGEESPGVNLSDSEIKLLIECAKKYSEKLVLAIEMAFLMGMRRAEITQLAESRIDLKKGLIRLRGKDTKTKRGRTFPIHPSLFTKIKNVIEGNEYLFPNAKDKNRPMSARGFSTTWTKVRKETGVNCRFHDLRHSFLTRAFSDSSISQVYICAYAGVSVQTAQKVYLHFSPDDLRMVCKSISLSNHRGEQK